MDECQKSIDDKDIAIKELQDKLNVKNAEVASLMSQLKTAQAQLLDAKARLAKCEEEKAALLNSGSGNAPTGTGTSGGTTPSGNGGGN